MYKEDLALNNPQWLICHKTPPKSILYYHCFAVFPWDSYLFGSHLRVK